MSSVESEIVVRESREGRDEGLQESRVAPLEGGELDDARRASRDNRVEPPRDDNEPAVLGGAGAKGDLANAAIAAGQAFGVPEDPADQRVKELRESPAFKALDPEIQRLAMDQAVRHDGNSLRVIDVERLVTDPSFSALSVDQQRRVLEVSAVAFTRRTELTELMQSGRLFSRDSQGATLLDNLHRIATGPIHQGFVNGDIPRADLVGSVIEETARPGQVNQANRGTCTVTSMQYVLCSNEPGEYARIVADLIEDGTSSLKNGDPVRIPPGALQRDDSYPARSDSERLFQSAMMDYGARGEGRFYSNIRDVRDTTGQESTFRTWMRAIGIVKDPPPQGGLDRASMGRVMDGLFGRSHTTFDENPATRNIADARATVTEAPERLGIVGFLSNPLRAVTNAFSSARSAFEKIAEDPVGSLTAPFVRAGESILGFLGDPIGKTQAAIESGVERVRGFFGGIARTVREYANRGDRGQNTVDFLAEHNGEPYVMAMTWGDRGHGAHAVTFTRVENGRVFFRNPWGANSDPVGTEYNDPPRRLENPDIREESMTIADFKRRVLWVHVPRAQS